MSATDGQAAERILRARFDGRLRRRAPIAPLTTFRIGGPAAFYVEPESTEDLDAIAAALRASGLPLLVLGKGSNVLIDDEGFPGVVVRLGRGFRWAARTPVGLDAGGAMPLPGLAGIALGHGLSGLEFAIAIPATVGGAVRMNAGAHGGSMADVVTEIQLYDLEVGRSIRVAAAEAGFAYRQTALPARSLVIGASLRLVAGDPGEIRRRMDDARAWRRETQPVGEPNCGSVFRNPEGDHAARLVEAAGCKGMRVGGAQVSTKHANFIVAGPGATAADVRTLIDAVRRSVVDRCGIELVPEVHVLGGADAGDGSGI